MRFTTWNVHRGVDARGNENFKSVAHELSRITSTSVFALQEIPSPEWVEKLADKLGCRYTHLMTGKNTGIALLYREHMIPGHVTSSVHRYTPICCSELRGLVSLSFESLGMTVFCTHFSAHATMIAQCSEARELLCHIEKTKGDVIVMGDLNSHSASPVLRKLRRHGLRDLWLDACKRPHGYFKSCTFPSSRPFQRIDYVLCRSANYVGNDARVAPTRASDHRRLTVSIKNKRV